MYLETKNYRHLEGDCHEKSTVFLHLRGYFHEGFLCINERIIE